jgi:hypothetical protein
MNAEFAKIILERSRDGDVLAGTDFGFVMRRTSEAGLLMRRCGNWLPSFIGTFSTDPQSRRSLESALSRARA